MSLRKKPFTGKVGGPLVVARRAGQDFTFAELLYWFHIMQIINPGSTYWNIAFGREKGEVAKDEEGMRTAWNFGKNCAALVKKLKGKGGGGIIMPQAVKPAGISTTARPVARKRTGRAGQKPSRRL